MENKPKLHFHSEHFEFDFFSHIYIAVILSILVGAIKLFFGNSLLSIIIFETPILDLLLFLIGFVTVIFITISYIQDRNEFNDRREQFKNGLVKCPKCHTAGAIDYDIIQLYEEGKSSQQELIYDFCKYCGYRSQPYLITCECTIEYPKPPSDPPNCHDDEKLHYYMDPRPYKDVTQTFDQSWLRGKS